MGKEELSLHVSAVVACVQVLAPRSATKQNMASVALGVLEYADLRSSETEGRVAGGRGCEKRLGGS